MKVLLFTSGLAPEYGGAAVSEASLIASLKSKVDLCVIARRGRVKKEFLKAFDLADVNEAEPINFFHAWLFRQGRWYDQIRQADLVHLNGHWQWEYHFVARICRAHKIPYLVHPRGMLLVGHRKVWLKRIFNFLLGDFILHHASRVVSLSHYETKQFGPYRLRAEQTTVIPNGVLGLSNGVEPAQAQAPQPHFLYFGRLERRKNLLFLLDAFADYRRAGGSATLRLQGPTERGYEKEISEKLSQTKLSNQACVVPPQFGGDKWRPLGEAMAVIYPCLDEAFGRVPFEAVLAGSLPILPKESGGAEYLASVLPDCIYETQNENSLVETLRKIESLTPEARRAQNQTARKWVEENLNWKKITESILGTYQAVLAENR